MQLPTEPNNYNTPGEKERLLATYAGIFPSVVISKEGREELNAIMKKVNRKFKRNYSK